MAQTNTSYLAERCLTPSEGNLSAVDHAPSFPICRRRFFWTAISPAVVAALFVDNAVYRKYATKAWSWVDEGLVIEVELEQREESIRVQILYWKA